MSAIIKRRKVQGKECFEVSWEEIDGLKTSIVPADLVERYAAIITFDYPSCINYNSENNFGVGVELSL